MKKILAMVAALVVMGGVACAGDFYNGDFQIQLGYGFQNVNVENTDRAIKSTEFDFGLQTWHLFRPIEMLGVGFMGDFDVGFGTTDNWKETNGVSLSNTKYDDGLSISLNVGVGPAVGLYLGNVVRFAFNIGYDAGFSYETPINWENNTTNTMGYTRVEASYSGLALGLQAKFVPESKVNPVIGWKLVKGKASTTSIASYSSGNTNGSGASYSKDFTYDYDFTQNILYAAISFSW